MSLGTVGWVDITVPDAEKLRDFYCSVVGWTHQSVDMGGYSDFSMITPAGQGAAGVCHARGQNANIPPVWPGHLMVADAASAAAACTANGGEVLVGPKPVGGGQFAIIRDPAGAVCALFQAG